MSSGRHRERIYDLFADPGREFADKVDEALAIGTEYLGLPIGFFTRIDAGVQEIVQATGDHPLIKPGETCPLDRAYCRRTIEIDSPLAVQSAAASGAISADAIETFDLGAYIGSKVSVNDEVYGTLCFAGVEEREAAFDDVEQGFVELIARLVGHGLERRRYERALAEREAELSRREERYRAVIDASFDLVFRVDTEGRFTYVSQAIEALLGYSADEYVGEPFTTMLPDADTIELAGEIYESVLAGQTVEEYYFPLQHRSSNRVFVDLRVTPIYETDVSKGERSAAAIVGVQGMARDATDRYRRERLIRVLNRVLRHNLRNDMNVIGGYADILQKQLGGREAELAGRIVATSDRLVTLSETARKLEQNLADAVAVEPTDVVPIVNRAAAQIDQRYADALITVDAPGSAVAAGAAPLETALWELADNAAKHGGDSPAVELSVRIDGPDVVIRVADDGPGLPAQERAVLETGEETSLIHGSGLGLWLVHWIVQSLDGQLELVDAADGTTIELRLPRATVS